MLSASTKARLGALGSDLDFLQRLLREFGSEMLRGESEPEEFTPLHLAALTGCRRTVEFLLERVDADPRFLVDDFSVLHCAAMNGHAEVTSVLLEQGVDPNTQTEMGYCPMHSAAWAGHVEVVRLLVEHGARSDLRNYRQETPLETAMRQGQNHVVALLRGAWDVPTTEGNAPNHDRSEAALEPPDLAELARLPCGIRVKHEPLQVAPRKGTREGDGYWWEHRTSVCTVDEPLVIEQFGCFVAEGGEWEFGNITGAPFTGDEFEKWYGCANAHLVPGTPAADEACWTARDEPDAGLTLWYYIGRNATGERQEGHSIVELLPCN